MVTTIDIGEADDIHPKNKQDVGRRTAVCALGNFYDRDIVCSGPVCKGYTKDGNKIILEIDHAKSGLMVGQKEG
jgi:sialate O-acetylesterase